MVKTWQEHGELSTDQLKARIRIKAKSFGRGERRGKKKSGEGASIYRPFVVT